LQDLNFQVDVYDPWLTEDKSGLFLHEMPRKCNYSLIILAVCHSEFVEMGSAAIKDSSDVPNVFYDLKSVFPVSESDARL